MNRLMIIGNLTREPETRATATGKTVCSFTVAVNRRGKDQGADYFRVSAWDKLGENCQRFLAKGRKVAVVGAVSVSTYDGQDGKTRASLEVVAQDVEFLSPQEQGTASKTADPGFSQVDDEELPF